MNLSDDSALSKAKHASSRKRDDLQLMSGITKIKGLFPFRIGTTSYIFPDDLIPNVEALADTVDDIELLFFEPVNRSLPVDEQTVERLKEISKKTGINYTVHLPLYCRLGHRTENERLKEADFCKRIIEHTLSLKPFGYVLHLNTEYLEIGGTLDISTWQDNVCRSVEELLFCGVEPHLICVENLGYPYEQVFPIVERFGLSVCLDIGHILIGGFPLEKYLELYLTHTRIIHLHGIDEGKDHRSAAFVEREVLSFLMSKLLKDKEVFRTITIEVFSESDLKTSLAVLKEFLS